MTTYSRLPSGEEVAGLLSPAIIAEGRFIYVSGQGPLVAGRYEPGTAAEETERTLENLDARLREAGCSRADVVRCGVFLADLADLDAMNDVYHRFFPSPRPARTTIQAGGLPGGIKVEIDCVALVAESSE